MGRTWMVIAVCIMGWPPTSFGDDHFRDHVAPIFQSRCLSCHNDSDREGEYSLQSAAEMFGDGHIVPGDAEASYLMELITPADGQAEMPQNSAALTGKEIATIRRWINAGAKWPDGLTLKTPTIADFDWWSFQPVRRPPLPECHDDPWVRNPIDAFILNRLNEKGLTPSATADRRTLVRRLTFDLHGLPPTADQVQAFVTDTDPRAWENLVDRLLASPHYGERWARHWLDVVQYADTCGFDKDKLRPNAWPYRDYVIRSFNRDKPWGRFVQEQIAGDALFPDEADGIIGLGFLAAGPWDFIGHVEVPESKIDGKVARNLDRDNMVANTFNAFCSVTVQCARCHAHKFDPVSQEQYYGLQAVFAAVDRADRTFDSDPATALLRRQLNERLEHFLAEQESLNAEILVAGGPPLAELKQLISQLESDAKKPVVETDPQFGFHSEIVASPDAEKWVQLDLAEAVVVEKIVLHPCHDDFAGIGAGFGFPRRFRVEISGDGTEWHTVFDQTQADFPDPGLTPLEIGNLPVQESMHLRVTASRLAERSADFMFALAEVRALDQAGHNVARQATITALDSVEMPVRWGKRNIVDGRWPVWKTDKRIGSGDLSADNHSDSLSGAVARRDQLLAQLETPPRAKRRSSIEESIRETRAQLAGLPEVQQVYAATTRFRPEGNFRPTNGNPRPVHLLHRGDVQKTGPVARPGVLPLRDDDKDWMMSAEVPESDRRVRLARWLTDREHPLVWRSIVNRVWLYHFGEGIVATPNDFGRMGAQPSHPQLLDWLTAEFQDNGQSLKQLHRLIVNSNAYRQSSASSVSNRKIDAGNQYLWRMNRRRLSAEEIRDSILSVSGVLNTKPGGPGFYLFELEKTEHSPHYEYHKFDPSDPETHRRSIYRFIVRSQPDPWMTTLDCADSSQSTPKRSETLTALQALSLLNSKFNLVMAEYFSASLKAESDDVDQQINQAIVRLLQRSPTANEQQELLTYARQHGLTNLCRFLFNLSEFVYID